MVGGAATLVVANSFISLAIHGPKSGLPGSEALTHVGNQVPASAHSWNRPGTSNLMEGGEAEGPNTSVHQFPTRVRVWATRATSGGVVALCRTAHTPLGGANHWSGRIGPAFMTDQHQIICMTSSLAVTLQLHFLTGTRMPGFELPA